MADDKPVIIIKKGGGHGGHHGGAWKVAYADFVTAMMAFFMVMWLVNSATVPTKQGISSYFRKPGIFQDGSGTPLQIGGAGILTDAAPPKPEEKKKGSGLSAVAMKKKSGSEDSDDLKRLTIHGGTGKAQGIQEGPDHAVGYNNTPPKDLEVEDLPKDIIFKEQAKKLVEEIKQQLAASPELKEMLGIVDVKVDADGLNIEIMDTDKASMFSSGSARISPEAAQAFSKLSAIITSLPNSVDIVGHTDAKPYAAGELGGYSNWELSADRANAARRLLIRGGLASERITSVVGRADKELRNSKDPLAAANRRITLKMRFVVNKSFDIAKDPNALKNLPQIQRDFERSQQKPNTPASPVKKAPEKVHSFSAADLIKQTTKRSKRPMRLDDDEKAQSKAPDLIGKDKLFGNSPVFGPGDFLNE